MFPNKSFPMCRIDAFATRLGRQWVTIEHRQSEVSHANTHSVRGFRDRFGLGRTAQARSTGNATGTALPTAGGTDRTPGRGSDAGGTPEAALAYRDLRRLRSGTHQSHC